MHKQGCYLVTIRILYYTKQIFMYTVQCKETSKQSECESELKVTTRQEEPVEQFGLLFQMSLQGGVLGMAVPGKKTWMHCEDHELIQ